MPFARYTVHAIENVGQKTLSYVCAATMRVALVRSSVLLCAMVLLLAALQVQAARGFRRCSSAEGRYFRTTPDCVYGGPRRFNGRPLARRAFGSPISVSMGGLYGPLNTG
jgi:hypothetical protein